MSEAKTIKELIDENKKLRQENEQLKNTITDCKNFIQPFECNCEPEDELFPEICCERCYCLNEIQWVLAEMGRMGGGK